MAGASLRSQPLNGLAIAAVISLAVIPYIQLALAARMAESTRPCQMFMMNWSNRRSMFKNTTSDPSAAPLIRSASIASSLAKSSCVLSIELSPVVPLEQCHFEVVTQLHQRHERRIVIAE